MGGRPGWGISSSDRRNRRQGGGQTTKQRVAGSGANDGCQQGRGVPGSPDQDGQPRDLSGGEGRRTDLARRAGGDSTSRRNSKVCKLPSCGLSTEADEAESPAADHLEVEEPMARPTFAPPPMAIPPPARP